MSPARTSFVFKDTVWLGGNHDGYPLTSLPQYLEVRGVTPDQADAAVYQSLCTFGLLESVMEVKIPESTLLSLDDQGNAMMTDENVPELLKSWRDRIRQLGTSDQCRRWAVRARGSLWQVYAFLCAETVYPEFSILRQDGCNTNELASIYHLIACVAEAVRSSSRAFPSWFPQATAPILSLPYCHIKKAMLSQGWCPFIIRIISNNVCVLSYASTRQPYIRKRHNKCDEKSCVINTVDTSNYSNTHTTEGCACGYSKPSLDQVIDSLDREEIPVVRQPHTNGDLSSSDGSRIPYIAISHVWVDGLGSTTEVGLPTCQINRLASLVGRLIPSGAFWMDALCIPKRRDMKKRAIGLMAKTYRDADAVLVIDTTIGSCSVSAPLEERLLCIISSGWMRRLWTLQEGLLARKLIFEFADGIATLDQLMPKGEDLFNTVLTSLASDIFFTKYEPSTTSELDVPRFLVGATTCETQDETLATPGSLNVASFGFRLGDVAWYLRGRTTNKAEDEIPAISGLLNIDPLGLVHLPASQRMRILLLRVHNLPSDIIFMLGPKLEEPNFRWAPKTLMGNPNPTIGVTRPYEALCTPQGLIAEYSVICFVDNTLQGGGPWFIWDGTKQSVYKVTNISTGAEESCCNVLLLMALPRPFETVACVACWAVAGESPPTDHASRAMFICEYRRHLVLTNVGWYGLRREKAGMLLLLSAWSNRIHVLVT